MEERLTIVASIERSLISYFPLSCPLPRPSSPNNTSREAQIPIYWVPVLQSLCKLILSITQGPTIWVPGLLGLVMFFSIPLFADNLQANPGPHIGSLTVYNRGHIKGSIFLFIGNYYPAVDEWGQHPTYTS